MQRNNYYTENDLQIYSFINFLFNILKSNAK